MLGIWLASTNQMHDIQVNLLPADHDDCRFQPVLWVDQITDIGNEMGV